MAVSLAPQHAYVLGDRVELIVDVTGDTAYPTNGSTLTAAQLGMSELDSVTCQLPVGGTRIYQYDYTNAKLKAFSALGTEVVNTTNISADVVRVIVKGKGYPITGP